MYQMTPPEPPRSGMQYQQRQQPQKRLNIFQILLIAAVLGFMIWYIVTSLTPESVSFATVESGTLGAHYTGDCMIVRDETPYDAEGVNSIEYIAAEGSTVYRGSTICNVYSSGFSTKEQTALQDSRDQIKEYEMKLISGETATDAKLDRLTSEVLNLAREARKLISGVRGNMDNQEKLLVTAIQNRQTYLKDKYGEDQRMSRLFDDEQSQLQRISSWTKSYAAMTEGIVSFYTDGYEYGLNANTWDQFTPAQVRSMMNGVKPEKSTVQKGKTTIYRMVQDGKWYVLMIVRDNTWTPTEGQRYELSLDNFRGTTVTAEVVSFARSGGEMLVRLAVEGPVSPVLYIRTCGGEIGDNVTTLTVPERAIYTQDNMQGVVVVDGEYQTFIPVNILEKRDGSAFITAIQQGVLHEGQTVRLF